MVQPVEPILEDVKTVRGELASIDKSLEILEEELKIKIKEKKIPDLDTNPKDVPEPEPENGEDVAKGIVPRVLGTIKTGLLYLWAPLRAIVEFVKDGFRTLLTYVTSIINSVKSGLTKVKNFIRRLHPYNIAKEVTEAIERNIGRLVELIVPLLRLTGA